MYSFELNQTIDWFFYVVARRLMCRNHEMDGNLPLNSFVLDKHSKIIIKNLKQCHSHFINPTEPLTTFNFNEFRPTDQKYCFVRNKLRMKPLECATHNNRKG